MRKTIIAAILLASLSFNSYSQEKPKEDSTDIPLISIKDLEQTLQSFSDKVSHNTYLIIQQAYQQALTDAINRKKQPKPKK